MRFLFERFYDRIYLFSRNITQNQIVAKDMAAECFMKVWQGRQKFFTILQIKYFLYTSAKNACINHLKAEKVRSRVHRELSVHTSEDISIDQDFFNAEIITYLRQQLEELPEVLDIIGKNCQKDNSGKFWRTEVIMLSSRF